MTPERWQQIEQLYHAALERTPEQRSVWLGQACAGDEALRHEVESLLASHAQAASFIEAPPDDIAAGMFEDKQANAMLGRTLGHYQLRSKIGAGGMGEVYRARDTRLDREVAVKILPAHLAEEAAALRRFEREAKAVAALSHPNILAIFDFGTENQLSYAVMELLEGETLRARLSRAALPWQPAVEIAAAIADGLAAAHAKGIIHRDLKPENIFLTADGRVKILDFGIARLKHVVSPEAETLTTTMTKPGMIMGTLGYMSPEQVRGKEVEAPSDIFSLGCVLYEMVSGERPFSGETGAEVIAAILKEEPPALTESVKQMPRELARVIKRCLEKRPEQRYQAARELALALRACLSGSGQLMPPPPRMRKPVRPAVWFGAALAILALGLAAWLNWAKPAQAIDSLAILPLLNASKDAEVEYLSDGITESLTNSLAQLPQLKLVIAQSTMSSYKGKEVDPRKVGQELNVRAVLAGKITRQDDALLIATELVNVADGAHLWGERYRKKLAEVMEVQTEIAQQISEKLRLALTGEQKQRLTKHHTDNTEAYQLYLKGRYYSNLHNTDGRKLGIEYLNRAVAADPAYALAYAGLALSYYDASGMTLTPAEAMPKIKAAALRALQLDETLAEAHVPLALFNSQHEWKWAEAEREFKRALELNPSYAQAHQYYAYPLLFQGRLDEAIMELTKAYELDPLTSLIGTNLAWAYYLKRQPDEAINRLRRINEIEPDSVTVHYTLGLAYEQKGVYEPALAELNKAKDLDPKELYSLALLGHAYANSGRRDEAQRMLKELKENAKRGPIDPTYMAIVCAGLGDRDQAFVWLEKAFEGRYENLLMLKVEPLYDNLRSAPRYTDLLRRLNLAP